MKNKKVFPIPKSIALIIAITAIMTLALCFVTAYAQNDTDITMKYDDYMDVVNKSVEIVDAGVPTSYKVGYGISANTQRDEAVITKKGNYLVATGIGTATVKINGIEYRITVEPAKISLLLLAGQSNMRGSEGDATASIVCPNGQVYSTYGVPENMTVSNAPEYVASSLASNLCTTNITGTATRLASNPIYQVTERGNGKIGADGAIGYEWNRLTGEKVWIVNAAHGGADMESWLPSGANYKEAVVLFSNCQKVLQKEIAAGHYTFSHMGYIWCQGESNTSATAEWYVEQFTTMHESFKKDFKIDIDSNPSTPDATMEFGGIITVRAGSEASSCYRGGNYPSDWSRAENYFESYVDLRMSGPRVAQIWMGNNPDLPDIWNISTIQEEWVIFPDGTNGVEKYFLEHYPNGQVDYPTHKRQGTKWYSPRTPEDVHPTIHYSQIGYNEIGREVARNVLYNLGMVEPPETEVKVEFVGWDGFSAVSSIEALTTEQSSTLIVPMVYPIYKSKEVALEIKGDFTYDYYDLVANSAASFGGIVPIGASGSGVTVTKKALGYFAWEFSDGTFIPIEPSQNTISKVAGSYKDGILSNAIYELAEDAYLYCDEGWSIEWTMTSLCNSSDPQVILSEAKSTLSSESFGIIVNSKAQSIAVGTFNSSGVKQQYGVVLSDHSIDMSESHVYKIENRVSEDGENMLYLWVDGKEISAMNNVLKSNGADSGEDSDWINGKNMLISALGTSKLRLNDILIEKLTISTHAHQYTDEVTAPTCTQSGFTTHTCSCGYSFTDSEVGKADHTYDNAKDKNCNVCGAQRQKDSEGGCASGCASAKSTGLALVSLFICAQCSLIFKKRRF